MDPVDHEHHDQWVRAVEGYHLDVVDLTCRQQAQAVVRLQMAPVDFALAAFQVVALAAVVDLLLDAKLDLVPVPVLDPDHNPAAEKILAAVVLGVEVDRPSV